MSCIDFSKVVKLLWECGLKNEIIIECLLWGNTVCCVCLVAQSYLTLCDPMDCSPPGSSVHGILQARILERVTMPSSRGSSQPRDWTMVSWIAGGFLLSEPPGKCDVWRDLLRLVMSDLWIRVILRWYYLPNSRIFRYIGITVQNILCWPVLPNPLSLEYIFWILPFLWDYPLIFISCIFKSLENSNGINMSYITFFG